MHFLEGLNSLPLLVETKSSTTTADAVINTNTHIYRQVANMMAGVEWVVMCTRQVGHKIQPS